METVVPLWETDSRLILFCHWFYSYGLPGLYAHVKPRFFLSSLRNVVTGFSVEKVGDSVKELLRNILVQLSLNLKNNHYVLLYSEYL